ncbi:hypothetical protein NSZ01_22450 [Nocardioides szechwanensis]|uniref:Uncharacterized protein n=1 Tax=Nocardioides szechwanensis TaxID=1005944 RepID=A0A1H0IDJ8_9ACTN|nr:hypothetical protein [Nocardioides szechwanensis]GEP34477.1 hypothetical protein NSZ01_22450 [Nocardioides szechwanensis]SDO29527.1 hypothetical protein SAMN05192576_3767 [Nocardioides szechwanensis]
MRVEAEAVEYLRFEDGSPVRAASAVARFGDGFLVSQDDATSACWWRSGVGTPVRLLPPVDGHDTFSEAEHTKALKPDLEAALHVTLDDAPAVLLLGSGSTEARMRAVLVGLLDGVPWAVSRDLPPLYALVADLLGVDPEQLNLEGACVLDGVLRWFHRGRPAAGLSSSSVDLDLAALVAAVAGRAEPADLHATGVRTYDVGDVEGVGLAITDAVVLPDGAVLVSAAAEDSPNAYDDGPVRGSALAVLHGSRVSATAAIPRIGGRVAKVEGLALLAWGEHGGRVLAVVDEDDPTAASALLTLRVSLP